MENQNKIRVAFNRLGMPAYYCPHLKTDSIYTRICSKCKAKVAKRLENLINQGGA